MEPKNGPCDLMTRKKTTIDDAAKAAVRGLRRGMQDNSEVVEERDAAGSARIKIQKIGQKQSVSGKVSSFNEFDEEDIVEKRNYRKAGSDDLYDPDQSPRSEANIETVKLGPRVSRDHRELFNTVSKGFPTSRAALERAIELLAEDQGIDSSIDNE